jgi:hypothetical protein
MKMLALALALGFVVGSSAPAAANILEVTTSVTMPVSASEDDVRTAVNAAAREVIAQFQPAILAVAAAYIRAGRLYVHFLVADDAGARALGIEHGDGNQNPLHPGVDAHDGIGRGLQI